jgi:YihY family inner membrane protein
VFVSVLGLVLRGNPSLRASILDSALAQFPIIGDQIKSNVKGLTGGGAGVALGIGTITALWAGLGVTQATQNAMNDVWDVPIQGRPNFLWSRLRGLLMLLVLGTLTLASTLLAGLGSSTGELGVFLRMVGFAGTAVLNLAAFLIAFRVLTDKDLTWRDVFAGAAFAAVAWTILQAVGGWYITHELKHATQVYGFFGFVLGLLAWIYLGAQVMLLGAEINVVKVNRLWPRGLKQPPYTQADRRTLARKADVEGRVPPQDVDVSFREPTEGEGGSAAAGGKA